MVIRTYIQFSDIFAKSDNFTCHFTSHDERCLQGSNPVVQHAITSQHIIKINSAEIKQ